MSGGLSNSTGDERTDGRSPVVSATVIIPSHGRPDLLRQCLESLRTQSYSRHEVVVVDDASPQADDYAALARRYGARLLRNPVNLGQSAGRNRGVRESSGDVLIFLDDDCVVRDPDWIAHHVRLHAAEAGILVGGGIDNIATTPAGWAYAGTNPQRVRAEGNLQTMNFSLTRSTFLDVGPFREDLRELEDVEYSVRALRMGRRLRYVPDLRIDHHFRTTLGGIMKRTFQYGFWTVPVYTRNRIAGYRRLPSSLVSAVALFLPIAVAHTLLRVLVSIRDCPAAAVYVPFSFLFCLSHAAGIVWYHYRLFSRK